MTNTSLLNKKVEEFYERFCPRYWHRKSTTTFRSKVDYIEFIHLSEYDANELLFKEFEFWEALNRNDAEPLYLQEYAECLWELENIDKKIQS